MHPLLQPTHSCRGVAEIDLALLRGWGVRGVLLDLDNTLTPWKSLEIAPEVLAWVAGLRDAGFGACLLSNAATARRVRPVAEALDIPWITRALKPLPAGFRRAMARLGTAPDTTAMVGDQLFTDIYGGNRLGLFTVLVDPISPHESIFTRSLQRPLERLVGRPRIGV